MSKAKKLASLVALQITLMAAPAAVFAQSIVPSELSQQTDPIAFVRAIIRFILLLAFVLAFIFLLIGGLRWITAGGDEKSVEGARGMITAALIGLVIVLLAYAIIRVVETFFGFSILTGTLSIPTVSGS